MNRSQKIITIAIVSVVIGLGLMFYAYKSAESYIVLPAGIMKGIIVDTAHNIEIQFSAGNTYKELIDVNGQTLLVAYKNSTYYVIYQNPINTVYYLFTGIPEVPKTPNLVNVIGPYTVIPDGKSVLLVYDGKTHTYKRGQTVTVFTVGYNVITVYPYSYTTIRSQETVTGSRVIPPQFPQESLYSATMSCGACITGTFVVPGTVYAFKDEMSNSNMSDYLEYNALSSTIYEHGFVKSNSLTMYFTKTASGTTGVNTVTIINDGETTTTTETFTVSITPIEMYKVFENLPVITLNGETMFYDGNNNLGFVVNGDKIIVYRVDVSGSKVNVEKIGIQYIISASYTTIVKK